MTNNVTSNKMMTDDSQPNVVVVSGSLTNHDGANPLNPSAGRSGPNGPPGDEDGDVGRGTNPHSSDGSTSSEDEDGEGNARRDAEYNNRSLTPARESLTTYGPKNRARLPDRKPRRRYAETKDFKHLGMEKFKGEEVLPSFYGLEDWFAQGDQAIQDHALMMNVHWNEDARRMAFRQHLEGKARNWYTQRYKAGAPTLEEMMKDMRVAYGMSNDTMYISNMIQATKKKVGESYESYARGLERLAQSGPEHAYNVMMEAVVRSFAKNANPKYLSVLTVLIPKNGKNKEFFSQDILASMVETLVSIDGTGFSTVTPEPTPVPLNSLNAGVPTNGQERGKGFQGDCFYCHRKGHRAMDCRKKKFDERNDRGRGRRDQGEEHYRNDRGNYGNRNRNDRYGGHRGSGGERQRSHSRGRDDDDEKDNKTQYFQRGN